MTYQAQAAKKPRLSTRLIAKWFVCVFIVIAAAVVYVWQRNTVISLGYDMNKLRKEASRAGEEEQKLRATLVSLQTAQRLLTEVKQRQLGLQDVSPSQRMSLVAPRRLGLASATRETLNDPPAASQSLANVTAATPHRGNSVLKRRR